MIGLELGDLSVVDRHPAKLMKALAVISEHLHAALDAAPFIEVGKSKRSCILASLTVRDFLHAIGFADAVARPVGTLMFAYQDGKELHSLGIGIPAIQKDDDPEGWIGHMVVTLASTRTLIDTTLYPCWRKQWPLLPGMLAVKLPRRISIDQYGLKAIAGLQHLDAGYRFGIMWLDDPENNVWQGAPDTDPSRRAPAVAKLIEHFGAWQ